MYIGLIVTRRVRDVLVRFQPNMNNLDIFSMNPLTSNFANIHSDDEFHAERELVGQTDRHDDSNSCLRQFWTDI